MKNQMKWGWTFAALAVLASPFTLDHVVGKYSTHGFYRTIASEENPSDPYPHLSRLQATQVNQNTTINITLNDPEVIKKLNDQINAEKAKSKELTEKLATAQSEISKSQADLEASKASDAAKAVQIAELEKQLGDQVSRIAELEAKVKELEGANQVSKEELDKTKLALDEAKKAADTACLQLEEANKKVAAAEEALKSKEEELKKKEEELLAKTEEAKKKDEALALKEEEAKKREEELARRQAELDKSKKDHDFYVCQSEERFSVLGKQIEDLNKQQQQFTQVMLGLNQVLISMFSQMHNQQQPMNILGMNQNGGGYFGNQMNYGQMQSPAQNVIMGSYPFNPWMQQQPSVTNNYYGAGMGMMGMGQQMGGFGQQSLPYYQQPQMNQIPGSFNFGMPGMDDSGRAVFGQFQTPGMPQQSAMMPGQVAAPMGPMMF
ncbi:MAG: hypothetical protein K2P81_00245 [Bacteriovoracaceae bacterium]|nr:hypothetical protein [Bacteriovoracaceae bacterium]